MGMIVPDGSQEQDEHIGWLVKAQQLVVKAQQLVVKAQQLAHLPFNVLHGWNGFMLLASPWIRMLAYFPACECQFTSNAPSCHHIYALHLIHRRSFAPSRGYLFANINCFAL
jgi:hypothetical protein